MNNSDKPIYVTKPSLPVLREFMPYLKQMWSDHQLTNFGQFHQEFEAALKSYLGINHVSLYSNGTLALIAAIKILELTGEIITTPYSFVATAHAIKFCGLKPVFVDIESQRLGINPDLIRQAITPRTTAIMPVHVYGYPCMMNEIEAIAREHNLKVVYDAAHAFGVQENNKSILNRGDLSILSFHATKLFSTIEGGAVTCNDRSLKVKLDLFRNFGIIKESEIPEVGINAKMNELQASFGLMQLKHVDSYIESRRVIVNSYRNMLRDVRGVTFLNDIPNIRHNYNYFPIFVNKEVYGINRDSLYNKLKEHNIFARKYFYPLLSNLSMYRHLPSANPPNLKNANEISSNVLCLPLYPDLNPKQVKSICKIISRECKCKTKR